MDFSNRIELLQSGMQPKILETLEIYSRKFGADFVFLVFKGEQKGIPFWKKAYLGDRSLGRVAIDAIKEFALNRAPGSPIIYSIEEYMQSSGADLYDSELNAIAFINVAIADAEEAIVVLGFETYTQSLPKETLGHAYELVNTYTRLVLYHALSSEVERQNYLRNFGKLLVEVHDYKQLSYLLESTLKPFLGYSHCSMFLLDSHKGLMQNIFFDSEIQLPIFPFKQSIAIATFPVDDIIDTGSFRSGEKAFLDFERLTQSREVQPYLRQSEKVEDFERLLYNLYSGREVIGNCIFLFPKGYKLSAEREDLLTVLIDLLSTTLVKVVAIEKTKVQREEMEILQALNTEITFNRDKNTLLKAISPKLKLLFNYSHQFVVAINEDQLTVTGLLDDAESVLRFHKKYKEVASARLPISDPIFTKVLLSNDPIVFDLELLQSRQPMPVYMAMNMELGIKKIAMVSLRVGSSIIGIWAISLLANQNLSPYQLELMKGVSHQLSIAVENIRTSSAAHQKALEKEFLSQISSDITWIRKRSDVEKLFDTTMRNYLGFDHAVLLLKNKDNTYSHFSWGEQMAGTEGKTVDIHFKSDGILKGRFTVNDTVGVFDMEELTQSGAEEYLLNEFKSGVKKKVCVRLRKDKLDIGLAFFNFSRQIDHSQADLELYHNFSSHLSIALSNVLANEEIARKEQERELLLSLITEIASIRNPQQLVRTITSELKEFLGFKHLSIGTLNEDQKSVDVFIVDPESVARFHPEYQQVAASRLPVNDGVISRVLDSPVPLSFNLDELAAQIELPAYLRINRESGIKQIIAMRFLREQLPFGTLVFFFDQETSISPSKLSLIGGLGNQISIAISNILANQELERRAMEETRLVNLGYELRSVKDLDILWKTVELRLKELFQIENFLVTMFHEDQKRHKSLFIQERSKFLRYPELGGLDELQAVGEGVFGHILNSDTPVLFGADEEKGKLEPLGCLDIGPLPCGSGTVGLIMKVGHQPIGFLLFEHLDLAWLCKRKQLFESIISQTAIVTSNILSNKRIEVQLQEINIFKEQLEQEKIYLTDDIVKIHDFKEIIGASDALEHVFKLVSKVSPSDSSVLILGETGTGKELIARAIHNNSPRKAKPMVKVNCAALPANLIESELFGHEKGSFTGATERRLGKFELANKGTLFLDEIGEMPIDLQVKLLRALQEKEIERVGGKETIKVDVRIIAATNRNLEKEISEGRFRNDLFYRLNIFPISLPPLRDRKQDIEPLALHFIKYFNKNCGKNIDSISTKAVETLMMYDWPGNVRELEHLIERSVLMNKGSVLTEILLPSPLEQLTVKAQFEEFTLRTIDENEKDYILKVLRYCRGRIAGNGGAAQILGVPPTTLNSKIKRLGIKREHISPDYQPPAVAGPIEYTREQPLHKN